MQQQRNWKKLNQMFVPSALIKDDPPWVYHALKQTQLIG